MLEAERSFQKARCNYLKQGDRCTKFFHDLILRNNKLNSIVAIRTSSGNTTTVPSKIACQFVEFYQWLLGAKVHRTRMNRELLENGPCVSFSDWQILTAPVLIEEVRLAFFDIDIDKSPGSDGFDSHFFKSSWHIIGFDVLQLCRSSLSVAGY